MEKKKCKQCGKNFEAKRSDSLYCSNPCKQQAHHKRSTEKSNLPDKEKEIETFYFEEYQSIKWEGFDIITFCFLRRNLSHNVSEEELKDYLDAVLGVDDDWRLKYDNIRKTKAFAEFQEVYLSNNIKVLTKEKS